MATPSATTKRSTTLRERSSEREMAAGIAGMPTAQGYATPSFFCRLDEEVVYWNISRSPGLMQRKACWATKRRFLTLRSA